MRQELSLVMLTEALGTAQIITALTLALPSTPPPIPLKCKGDPPGRPWNLISDLRDNGKITVILVALSGRIPVFSKTLWL